MDERYIKTNEITDDPLSAVITVVVLDIAKSMAMETGEALVVTGLFRGFRPIDDPKRRCSSKPTTSTHVLAGMVEVGHLEVSGCDLEQYTFK